MDDTPVFSLIRPEDTRRALGALVRALRQRQDLTQAMLAKKAGVPVSTLSLFEREGSGGVDTLVRLLMALGELDAFHKGVEDMTKSATAPRTWRELELREEAAQRGVKQRVRIKKPKAPREPS